MPSCFLRNALRSFRPPAGAALGAALLVGWCGTARAATWADSGTTPRSDDLVALDETGEEGWLFGAEDLAGDGAAFDAPEQAADMRSGYARLDGPDLYVRVYYSHASEVATTATLFAYVDSDGNPGTGGPSAAPEVDAALDAIVGMVGYEHILQIPAVRADGGFGPLRIWEWVNRGGGAYEELTVDPSRFELESEADRDPLRHPTDGHAYLQARLERALIGMGATCLARFHFRTVLEPAAAGSGSDLVMAHVNACTAPPDVFVDRQCAADDDCPAGGICSRDRCIYPRTCRTAAECVGTEVCEAGRCVPAPAGDCAADADCGARVCRNALCSACTATGDCAAGRRCAPDGTCVVADADPCTSDASCGAGRRCTSDGYCTTDGAPPPGGSSSDAGPAIVVDAGAGDNVQGGACNCRLLGGAPARDSSPMWLLLAAAGLLRRRR